MKAPKIQWLSFDISVTEHEDTLLESFKEKYLWLKDLKPKQIMFVLQSEGGSSTGQDSPRPPLRAANGCRDGKTSRLRSTGQCGKSSRSTTSSQPKALQLNTLSGCRNKAIFALIKILSCVSF